MLQPKKVKRFRVTTRSKDSHPKAPNVLNRQFAVEGPDKAWAGDITYLWTDEGWLYLAVLLDLFSRRVVGWATSEWLTKELALAALRRALVERNNNLHFSFAIILMDFGNFATRTICLTGSG